MSEKYIKKNFTDIKRYSGIIENRVNDDYCTMENLMSDNNRFLEFARKYNVNYIFIDDEYNIDIDLC